MSKKMIAILLTLAMLLSFAGCGSAASSAAQTSQQSSAEETSTAAAEAAPEAAAPETAAASAEEAAPAEEAASAEEAPAEPEEDRAYITYPLEGDNTLSLFISFTTTMVGDFMDSYYDNTMLETVNELTGVTLEFVSPADTAASDQFNLMVASGDMTDFMSVSYYTGGVTKAYEDEVIYDLTDYMDECAPDYMEKLSQCNEDTRKAITVDGDRILSLYQINDGVIAEQGLQIRADWLDALGLELPTTTDELYDTLVAIKNEYNPTYPYSMSSTGTMSYIVGAFGVPGFTFGQSFLVSGLGLGEYIDTDGATVRCTLQSDGFYEYLEYLKKFMDAGLLDPEFYGSQSPLNNPWVATGETACWDSMYDAIDTNYAAAEDPDFQIAALPNIVKNEGDTYHFGAIQTTYSQYNWVSISTNCEDVELALNYANWFYTEDSFVPANFGEEGVSFEYDADGNPQYTDVIYDNEKGNAGNMLVLYCFNALMPTYNAYMEKVALSSDAVMDAIAVWTDTGYDQTFPSVSYTAEETEAITAPLTDIETYATEAVLRWVVGDEELNEENWAAFQSTLSEMGLDDVIAQIQQAYDRYAAL